MYRRSPFPKHFEHGLHHRFGHVWSMYRNTMTTATYHPKTFFGYYTQAPGGVVGNYFDNSPVLPTGGLYLSKSRYLASKRTNSFHLHASGKPLKHRSMLPHLSEMSWQVRVQWLAWQSKAAQEPRCLAHFQPPVFKTLGTGCKHCWLRLLEIQVCCHNMSQKAS